LIGPDGPELDYPARALGPTEVCTPLDGLAVVRAAPGNLNDAAIFAMAWSRYINPAWAIAEITRTEEEASVRLYRSGSARALKVWNPRWRLAPPAPPGVDDLFAQEMARSATWTWDHSQMTALAREDRIDHPLDHLCHVLRIPSIEPLLADAWPPDIAPGLRRYPYEPEARFRRVRAWTGAKLKLGRWRRRFQSKDRPPEPPAAG
ncbi:MAG: hypothetical protein LBM66_06100, partial [Bifidobacteriaceae bacterium]|nr:hypothetical protein [Bifidobacteriaceae bacterium]